MFYGPMKEKTDPIVIKDTTVIAFHHMLKYIHEDVIDLTKLEVEEMFFTADQAERYNLPGLKTEIMEFLKTYQVTESNIFELTNITDNFPSSPTFLIPC